MKIFLGTARRPWYVCDAAVCTDREWMLNAKCRGEDPELRFPNQSHGDIQRSNSKQARTARRTALAFCAACPVRKTCLEYALSTSVPFGIYGGLDEIERAQLRRARA